VRAVALRNHELIVRDDLPDPTPDFGQVLVEVKACGICGSDLHFAKHGHEMMELGRQMEGMPDLGGGPNTLRPDVTTDVFMGHEFSAEVLDVGPNTEGPKPGTIVTSIPIMMTMTGIRDLAYSTELPSGYGERMLLSVPMLNAVPNGLDPRHAALTEPMAVGLHGVNKSEIKQGEGAVVLGCGPVGLAVIAALKLKGIEPIVASDFSPARRALAQTMGAHVAVDPATESPFEKWAEVGGAKALHVYEAIGVPGILNEAMRVAPRQTTVTVVGVCMQPDTITPFFGIAKELKMQFVLGYDPMEFSGTLRSIAEGDIDVAPMITGEVPLDGVAGAFDALANPDDHCKILVLPNS
jgi:threonine dehydrogenase-like Zn-dependent dehydrogenase